MDPEIGLRLPRSSPVGYGLVIEQPGSLAASAQPQPSDASRDAPAIKALSAKLKCVLTRPKLQL